MNATLTLDDDVVALLERARRNRRQTPEELGNDLLRQTLRQLGAAALGRRLPGDDRSEADASRQVEGQEQNGRREFQQVLEQLHTVRGEVESGYRDLARREHTWRAFQRLATHSLWEAVAGLENDAYRQQLADVLDAAVAGLPAFQLKEEHLTALDLTLARLAAADVTEQDVDSCENAWRDVGVDTLPSLGEAFEEWLASSDLDSADAD